MSVEIIQERLATYNCNSTIEEDQALREIAQEIILAGLGRTDFFRQAGFQGGTCLRIFHSLTRFSEDMDFALIKPDAAFALPSFLDQVRVELEAFGYALEIEDRSRSGATVQQAFVKDESVGKLLHLNYRPRTGPMRKLRIKLEVDTNPPGGASYDMPVLDYPFPSAVRVFDLPSLFAGKIHALLCRNYLKGRDWYDFIWYTARRTPINHALRAAGIACDERLIAGDDYDFTAGRRAAEDILRQGVPFTAMVAASDMLAIGAMQVLQARGLRVPDEVSVVGCSNLDMSPLVTPALTTLDAKPAEMATTASRLLLDQLQHGVRPAEDIAVAASLIVRESTAKVPKGDC